MSIDRSGLSWRRAAAVHVAALAAAGLAACGGGGGNGGGSDESAYLRFAEATGSRLQVWDPATPDQVLVDTATDGSTVFAVRRRRVDSAARTWAEAEVAQIVYTHQGQVYRIDLRGGHAHEPVALSTLSAGCGIDSVEPLDADGAVAVVSTREAPAQDRCFDSAEPRLLHTGMNAGSSAVAGSLVAVLAGDDAQASAVLVSSGLVGAAGRLSLLTPGLSASSALQGGVDASAPQWLGRDPAQAGLGYVHDGQALRALSWTPSSATLGDPLLTLSAAPTAWRANAQALWIATTRGELVRAQAGGATLVADLALVEGSVPALVPTATRVLANVCVTDLNYLMPQCTVKAMPLAGGSWTTLYTDRPGTDSVSLIGAVGERPLLRHDTGYYFDFHGFGRYAYTALRLLGADGSAGELLSHGTSVPVWAPRHPIGQPAALAGALDCSAQVCASGELRYRPLSGSASTLGSWTVAGSSYLWPPRPILEGLPAELQRRFLQDLHPLERYTLTPGTAGSLTPAP